jgi:hypothetical protein
MGAMARDAVGGSVKGDKALQMKAIGSLSKWGISLSMCGISAWWTRPHPAGSGSAVQLSGAHCDVTQRIL